jgi:DNA polymerase-3 subunit delta'
LINYIFSLNESNRYNFEDNIISKNNYSYNLILKDSHPNFFSILKDEKKETGQISKIREMINFTNKSSFNAEFKIILIDNIEYLNTNSVNALLKVVEEPNNKIYFFLIHNSKTKILDTLKSRCIKFNLYLNSDEKSKIINKLLNNNFYLNLNEDFKNLYNSPGNIISLYNFFIEHNINEDISIDDFLKLIINKSLYKKNTYLKINLPYFIQLYFNKKINHLNSKSKIYYLYKYFLSKINNCNKYNLDIESILIEFNGKILNG